MPKIILTLFSLLLFMSSYAQQNNTRHVNVFIGTQGTGHTFPGASLPFGMVQPGPDNNDTDWAYTSGYQYKDEHIMGFSQTHLNGTGIGEMGDILILPYASDKGKNTMLKATEAATPGYYTVVKADSVRAELTCSERVAFHRYTFPEQEAKLYINFQHGIRFLTDSLVLDSAMKIENDTTLSGYCHTKNWVERTYFFVIKFDRKFTNYEKLPSVKKENAPKYILNFSLDRSKQLQVKVALSNVSTKGAKKNLSAEIAHWDFDAVHQKATDVWNKYLNRIDIEADAKKKTLFYTAMYHLLLQPSNIADIDGRYRGADNRIATAASKEYYSTLSNWDVYRAAFPLLAIIAPEKIDAIVNTMLLHHKAAGFLPIWTAWGQDNYCMIGNHAIPMIVGASSYGFTGFDKKEALEAIIETSTHDHIHSDWTTLNRYGYYPFDIITDEAVSKALENGYDDWCVSYFSRQMGDEASAAFFTKRAGYYKNTFDPETKLFRAKDSKGNWRTPFNPTVATSPLNNPGDYTEATAWQYFWTPAQYDIEGVSQLLGGKAGFTKQLNDFFSIQATNPNKYLGQEAMIGQYAHGNEPNHHIAYLYAYSDEPKQGQKHINHIINEFCNDTPDGMIGNDDCGQMSAWYILSCLGFYPLNPATNQFVFGAPQVARATLYLSNGNELKIEAKNLSKERIYVDKQWFNGQQKSVFISYQDLMKGGKLTFEMSDNLINTTVPYDELMAYCNTIPIVDAHEHLISPEEHQKRYLSFYDFLWSYCRWDLYSAGLDKKYIDSYPQNDAETHEWFNAVEPYLPYLEYSSYMRSVKIALKKYFGYDSLNRANYMDITQKLNATNTPEHYLRILQDAKIAAIINQSDENSSTDKLFLKMTTLNFQFAMPPKIEKAFEQNPQMSLDEAVAMYQTAIKEEKARGSKSIKFFPHVFKAPLSRELAEKEFEEYKHTQKYDYMSSLARYINEAQIRIAGKLGMIVTIHTGVWTDVSKMNPEILFPVVENHTDVKFEIYHMGIPYIREAAFLGKNYPNVYLNMAWAHSVSEHMVQNSLDEWIDLIPTNKLIAFGGDLITLPEHVVATLEMAKENICRCLAKRIQNNRLDLEGAKRILLAWFYENPVKLYQIEQ